MAENHWKKKWMKTTMFLAVLIFFNISFPIYFAINLKPFDGKNEGDL